jgi:hypothetical protein
MCAPGDQRKSNDNQRQHAELNALRCQRRPMFPERGLVSASREFAMPIYRNNVLMCIGADFCRNSSGVRDISQNAA